MYSCTCWERPPVEQGQRWLDETRPECQVRVRDPVSRFAATRPTRRRLFDRNGTLRREELECTVERCCGQSGLGPVVVKVGAPEPIAVNTRRACESTGNSAPIIRSPTIERTSVDVTSCEARNCFRVCPWRQRFNRFGNPPVTMNASNASTERLNLRF
jgi:hypothetical protein